MLIKSIRPIDVCAEICKNLSNSLKLLLRNESMKEYTLLNPSTKRWRRKVDKGLLDWLEHLLEYNRVSFGSNYIIPKRLWSMNYDYSEVLEGIGQYLFDALHNSDVYSKPRILSTENLATSSSSIFLKSKPDAIMNIGTHQKLYIIITVLIFFFFLQTRHFSRIYNVIIFTFG